jgi:putative hydrolase of the HAD superfamily
LSYEHGYAKPHQSIFVATLRKLGINTLQCLHVGDDPTADIQGAHNVGMKTAFIRRNKTKTDANIEIEQIVELTTFS